MPAWLIIASAIAGWVGALTGTLALLINWLNRRDVVREKAREKAMKRPWGTLHVGHVSEDSARLRVMVHHRGSETFRITRLRITRPRGAEIATTYSSEGPKDWPEGTRESFVDWAVLAPTFEENEFVGAWQDIWIRLPGRGASRLSVMVDSTRRQKLCKIVLIGETNPPMRDPIRIVATATIAL